MIGKYALLFAAATAASGDENAVKLNNGVLMPRVGVSNHDNSGVAAAFKAGITHFLTANDYNSQKQLGGALRALGVSRDKFFVTSMTSPCQCNQKAPHCIRNLTDMDECYKTTMDELQSGLDLFGFPSFDLVLLHGPNEPFAHPGACSASACEANKEQWKAYQAFLAAGKTRAIGVSNFCKSCFECIADGTAPVPAVNQVQYHLGFGTDPEGLTTYHNAHGIVLQAYEPLASGRAASDPTAVKIGKAHNKTGAQVAMRWVLQNPAKPAGALITSSSNPAYLAQDADLFDWELTAGEMAELDAVSCKDHPDYCTYANGQPGWGCSQ